MLNVSFILEQLAILLRIVDNKRLFFKENGPNVKNDPLPGYNGPNVNVVEESEDFDEIKIVEEVRTPLLMVYTKLAKCGLIKGTHDNCEECATSPEGCQLVKEQVQELMNLGILQISRARKMADVSVIEPHFENNTKALKPVEILYEKRDVHPLMSLRQPVVICVPSPFPYKRSKTVPWNYDATAFVREPEERAKDEPTKAMDGVTHISEGSGMTRSG